jgi:hypothetical protein
MVDPRHADARAVGALGRVPEVEAIGAAGILDSFDAEDAGESDDVSLFHIIPPKFHSNFVQS